MDVVVVSIGVGVWCVDVGGERCRDMRAAVVVVCSVGWPASHRRDTELRGEWTPVRSRHYTEQHSQWNTTV